MSRKELVFLVSRAFALLLISWAFAEITYLPERLYTLSHHLSQSSVLVGHDYWSSYYSIITVFLILRMLAFLLAAAMFLEMWTTDRSILLAAAAGKSNDVKDWVTGKHKRFP